MEWDIKSACGVLFQTKEEEDGALEDKQPPKTGTVRIRLHAGESREWCVYEVGGITTHRVKIGVYALPQDYLSTDVLDHILIVQILLPLTPQELAFTEFVLKHAKNVQQWDLYFHHKMTRKQCREQRLPAPTYFVSGPFLTMRFHDVPQQCILSWLSEWRIPVFHSTVFSINERVTWPKRLTSSSMDETASNMSCLQLKMQPRWKYVYLHIHTPALCQFFAPCLMACASTVVSIDLDAPLLVRWAHAIRQMQQQQQQQTPLYYEQLIQLTVCNSDFVDALYCHTKHQRLQQDCDALLRLFTTQLAAVSVIEWHSLSRHPIQLLPAILSSPTWKHIQRLDVGMLLESAAAQRVLESLHRMPHLVCFTGRYAERHNITNSFVLTPTWHALHNIQHTQIQTWRFSFGQLCTSKHKIRWHHRNALVPKKTIPNDQQRIFATEWWDAICIASQTNRMTCARLPVDVQTQEIGLLAQWLVSAPPQLLTITHVNYIDISRVRDHMQENKQTTHVRFIETDQHETIPLLPEAMSTVTSISAWMCASVLTASLRATSRHPLREHITALCPTILIMALPTEWQDFLKTAFRFGSWSSTRYCKAHYHLVH